MRKQLGLSVWWAAILVAALSPSADAAEASGGPDAAGAFHAFCAAQAAAADKAEHMAIVGKDGWLFFAGELRHLGAGKFWGPEAAAIARQRDPQNPIRYPDPLPTILNVKSQLDAMGIELLVVPVPCKAVVYPERLCGDVKAPAGHLPPRLDTWHQQFLKALADAGVGALDLVPAFVEARKQDGEQGPVYCKQDTHWSGRACAITAKLIAEKLRSRAWLKSAGGEKLVSRRQQVTLSGDLWHDLERRGQKLPRETMMLRFVGTKGPDGPDPVEPAPAGSFVLLGDSHTLIFHAGGEDMQARGAGLFDQLILELGVVGDLVGVRGSGATPARINLYHKGRREADYWKTKKLIIWCFSAREFTESMGWNPNVPVARNP